MKGRCKSGSHNYLSKVAVAMRYKQKTKQEIIEHVLELDKKHNAKSDFFYFECRTRRWPRNNSMRENADKFVQEIIENHDPRDAQAEKCSLQKMAEGFFYEKENRDGTVKIVPDYNSLADYFNDVLRYRFSDEKAYIYGDGFYEPIHSGGVNALIDKLTLRQASPAHFAPFKIKIQANCYTDFSKFLPPPRTINVTNGVLFLDSKELKPHDPVYAFKYKLPHNYNPKAKCPRFMKFLKDTFNQDEALINLVGEIMGYTLMGGEPVAHRAFAFYGEGRNGKSTLLDVILELLGKDNVSAVSMKNIDKPFSTVSMDGKIANIVEESPAKIDAEAFKNIVGGGYVTAAHKGKPEYDLKVQARLFFACNKLPVFRESTVAIKDRIIFVPFVNYIKKKDRDVKIKERLSAEIEGVLNFAIEGLERYQAQGFTESKASEELMREYQKESDSVFDWASENITLTFNFADFLPTEKAYESYLLHCGKSRVREVSRKSFEHRFSKFLVETLNETDNGFQLDDLKKKDRVTNRHGYTCLRCPSSLF